jgi:hypothetical protein
VTSAASLPPASLLACALHALTLRPAYALLVERGGRELILVVRGTHSSRDTLTCLTASVQPHHGTQQTHTRTHASSRACMHPHAFTRI